jgi:tRNA dimethylallyltransferase
VTSFCNSIIFILGPTASGKSETAAAVAQNIGGEIVSCDSMQIYRGMEIVAQSPGVELTRSVRHHLVGVVPSGEEFNAAKFVDISRGVVEDIISRGKIPVFSGGTGLYVKALLDGIFHSPPQDKEFRLGLEREAREKGNMHLYRRLKKIDPEATLKIEPQNLRRIIRALEVFELTGKTFSEKKKESRGIADEYETKLFALEVPRDVLIRRIDSRVEAMFASGLVDEVRALMGAPISSTASKALGIKEAWSVAKGETGIETAKEELKIRTRQYAKRQMTWLRAVKRIEWVNAERAVTDIAFDIVRKTGLGRNERGK